MCDYKKHDFDPTYTDMGDHWLVEVICPKCGKVIKSWTEPKTEEEK